MNRAYFHTRDSDLPHLYIRIERIPGGTRENDGLETGIMGGCGREDSVDSAEQQRACVASVWLAPSTSAGKDEVHTPSLVLCKFR